MIRDTSSQDAVLTAAPAQRLKRRALWIGGAVAAVALGALLIPLSRVVPPLYVWRVRSRVYRWYGQLRAVEQGLEQAHGAQRAQVCASLLQRLDDIEERVNQISIPLSFADALYGLRSHINFVRQRVRSAAAESEPVRAR